MIFTEPRFLLFFLVAFAVHWLLRGSRSRKTWLLACSYLFYAGWDWRFLSLILLSTGVDFVLGARIARSEDKRHRKRLLLVSLAVNLGLLGFFKYLGFFVDSAGAFLAYLGLPASDLTLQIVLPVGISFYTFQTLSYTLDIYKGTLKPTPSLLDFALFVGFFPQLVAGPIVRACDFLPQLEQPRALRNVDLRPLFALFLFGFIKKACISDNISPVIDPVYASPESYTALSNWLAAVLYHLQIYCDFSGYSDMAIACAGMLGYSLPLNFNFPYLAHNVAEFWHRWHISLSTWFRDYVYIPLGGNRVTTRRYLINLFATFTLSGLWHGASWNFVLWGFLHAVCLTVAWWWSLGASRGGAVRRVVAAAGLPLTTLVVVLTWVVFRALDTERGLAMLGVLSGLLSGGTELIPAAWWLLAAGFMIVHAGMKHQVLHRGFRALPTWAFAVVMGAAVALVLPFVSSGYRPFIYFQF